MRKKAFKRILNNVVEGTIVFRTASGCESQFSKVQLSLLPNETEIYFTTENGWETRLNKASLEWWQFKPYDPIREKREHQEAARDTQKGSYITFNKVLSKKEVERLKKEWLKLESEE